MSRNRHVELESAAPSGRIVARILETGEAAGPPSMKTISESQGTFYLTDVVAELVENPTISAGFRDIDVIDAVLQVELPCSRTPRAELSLWAAIDGDSDDDFGRRLAQLRKGDRSIRISGRYRFRDSAGSPRSSTSAG